MELSAFLDGALELLYTPLSASLSTWLDGSDAPTDTSGGRTVGASLPRLCDLCGLGEAEGLEAAVAQGAACIFRAFAKHAPSAESGTEGGTEGGAGGSNEAVAALGAEVRAVLRGCSTVRAADFV